MEPFSIIANSDHIQTWLNGVPVADMHDDLTSSGYIALQLHGIGKNLEKAAESDLATSASVYERPDARRSGSICRGLGHNRYLRTI